MTTVHTKQEAERSSMTKAESTPDTGQATAGQEFLAFLATTNKGRTATELTERMHELIDAIRDTGKGGAITYKVEIRPIDNAAEQDGAVKVTDHISLKLPQHDRPTSIFFVDEESNLVRNHPSQSSLFE